MTVFGTIALVFTVWAVGSLAVALFLYGANRHDRKAISNFTHENAEE